MNRYVTTKQIYHDMRPIYQALIYKFFYHMRLMQVVYTSALKFIGRL